MPERIQHAISGDEDVREALARALYDIDPMPRYEGEGDDEHIAGPKPWGWLGEGYRERMRAQADAILARFDVRERTNQENRSQ